MDGQTFGCRGVGHVGLGKSWISPLFESGDALVAKRKIPSEEDGLVEIRHRRHGDLKPAGKVKPRGKNRETVRELKGWMNEGLGIFVVEPWRNRHLDTSGTLYTYLWLHDELANISVSSNIFFKLKEVSIRKCI